MLCFRDAGWRGLAEQATELLPQVVRSYRLLVSLAAAVFWPDAGRNAPLHPTVVVQFVLDHLARPLADGC